MGALDQLRPPSDGVGRTLCLGAVGSIIVLILATCVSIGAFASSSVNTRIGTGDDGPEQFLNTPNVWFMAGVPGTFSVAISGSPEPLVMITGVLPSGLSFRSTGAGAGVISGIARSSSTTNVVLTATGGERPSLSQVLRIHIEPAATTGYYLVRPRGDPRAFGRAVTVRSTAPLDSASAIVSAVASPGDAGFYEAAGNGTVYALAGAKLFGSAQDPPTPIVAIASTADGRGYWLVSGGGHVYGFGDAQVFPPIEGVGPVVGLAGARDGGGYWLVTAEGHVFCFGGATCYGSMDATKSPVAAIAATGDGEGYYIVTSNGRVHAFGDARVMAGPQHAPVGNDIDCIAVTNNGGGYYLASRSGEVYRFGDAPEFADAANRATAGNVVAVVVPAVQRPRLQLGAYVGPADPSGLYEFDAAVHVDPSVASDYFDDRNWTGIDDDRWAIDAWRGRGLQMVWGVPLFPRHGNYSLLAGARGEYDKYFRILARNLISAGMNNAVLRLGWEFNTSSSPWYAAHQSEAFVHYWRQIVRTMRDVPGARFSFEWNVSRGDQGQGDQNMGNLAAYYPGDSYVDLIGMDIYDQAWINYPGPVGEFVTIMTQQWGLNWLSSFAAKHHEQMAIPEFGLVPATPETYPHGGHEVGGGDDPTFIDELASWAHAGNVENLVYWDVSNSSLEAGGNPMVTAALRSSFG